MKTLNVNQLACILRFHQETKSLFKDDVLVKPVSFSYDFKKNRYSLKSLYVVLVEAVNEFDDARKKMFGYYEFTTISTYDAEKQVVNCKPIYFVDADNIDVEITNQKLIDDVVSPFKRRKGGVQKCVDGLDEEVAVVGAAVDDVSMSECLEAESECSKYFPCNDSPFSNASLE